MIDVSSRSLFRLFTCRKTVPGTDYTLCERKYRGGAYPYIYGLSQTWAWVSFSPPNPFHKILDPTQVTICRGYIEQRGGSEAE